MKKPLLVFFLAVVATLESIWILKSDGFYFIDECAHFLFSRFVLNDLTEVVSAWHRPGRLWLFVLPAQLGHTFTMFFSLALFLCLLIVSYQIAKLQKIKHAEWAVLLIGLQPILFDISYTCLAEAPAALVIALSYWYHLKEKHGWSLAIASAVFLFRFEMYPFAVLLFCVYLLRREWKILPLVMLGPILWIASSTLITGDVMTFFREWSHFANIGKFIPGTSVTHYIENLQAIFGVAQLLLFIAGVVFINRAKRNAEFGIIYFTIALNIIINTLAGAEVFHWTGSIGELRYIAVVGPLFGIISTYGFTEIVTRLKAPFYQFIFSILILSVVVFNCTLATHPRRWPTYDKIVVNMTNEVRAEYPDLTLLSNNCNAAYAIDVPPYGGPHFAKLNKDMLRKYPECIILWDPFSSNSIFSQTELTKEKMLQDTTITVLDTYTYWNVEYLVLYRNATARKTGAK